ncbi:MAG: 1-acyl-sn-glycerol-3-phosphate acyltransferase [Bacteroidota bacterium]|nr:1-acyl-sn-glycerol-3-phosphate acyltransferase [Bacteroidota bacterium]
MKGAENIPRTGAYIICSNHTSFLDAFCIYSIFKQYFVFVGKKEIEKWPLFHIAYTSGMNILVDRNSRTGSVRAMKKILHEIDNGHPIVLFPEGTISKNLPQPGPFKPGAFTIAIQKQVPVLPITFRTNWKRLERSGMWKGRAGPGIAEIVIHKPVPTNGLTKEDIDPLQNQVRTMIINSL